MKASVNCGNDLIHQSLEQKINIPSKMVLDLLAEHERITRIICIFLFLFCFDLNCDQYQWSVASGIDLACLHSLHQK